MKRVDICTSTHSTTESVLESIRSQDIVEYISRSADDSARTLTSVWVRDGNGHALLKHLKQTMGEQSGWRLSVSEINATWPKLDEADDKTKQNNNDATIDQIIDSVEKTSAPSINFALMMLFASAVAASGLLVDSTAAVIGSMVIAPILSPLLGVSIGASVSDFSLIRRSTLSLLMAVSISVLLGATLALGIDVVEDPKQLSERSSVTLASIVFAICAGGAAGIARQSAATSALVGVMVAAAVVPAAAAVGIFFTLDDSPSLIGAIQLVMINIIAIIIVAMVVFLLSGIRKERV